MKILFLNYHHLDGNSGIHIFNLANQLTRLGAKCVVCVPGHKELTVRLGDALFETVNLGDVRQGRVAADFDLIHAWTPRENVRKMTSEIRAIQPCPYLVHLEDNEEVIAESVTRIRVDILKRIPLVFLKFLIPSNISHPLHYRDFLKQATGITIIIETLKEFCPIEIPNQVLWAGYQEDLNWNMPTDTAYKRHLGISDDDFVVAYTGNVHAANKDEVLDLYKAVAIANERGIRVRLIRTGVDYVNIHGSDYNMIKKKYSIELGHIPRGDMPSLLSMADVLIQPGNPGRFNDYRFPSKLPEYLASGKPVILPKTNIGHFLKNNEECILLNKGDPLEIAGRLEVLFSNEALRHKIGMGGRLFAERNLRWSHIAKKLYSFYLSLLGTKNASERS